MADLEDKDYRELQKMAKEKDLKATGKKEEILERLKESEESDEDSGDSSGGGFGNLKKDIEDELQGADKEEIESNVKRLATGVPGMDDILHGGIPENNLVLVSGGPGTGKTTIGLQFLLEGIKKGEKGVYVNLDERKDKIIRNAELFGWDLEKHIENDDLKFIRPDIFDFQKIKREVDNLASRTEADRIVIDSLSVIASAISDPADLRKSIMELNQRFNRLEATTITVSEVKEEGSHGVEEYAVDGILRLFYSRKESTFQRGIAVKKMRGSDHSNDIHPIEINTQGVKVFCDQQIFSDL